MILYHGSNVEVTTPDLTLSKPYKDFGQGFYLSADRNQALRMAEQKTLQLMCGEPLVSDFEFDETLLHDDELSVKIFEDYSVEWATFILKNRDIHEQHPVHNYDIVYGPFFICGLGKDDFISLEPELMNKLKKAYARPEFFLQVGARLMIFT